MKRNKWVRAPPFTLMYGLNFITLTTIDEGGECYIIDINVDKIVFIQDLKDFGSRIYSNGATMLVKETRDKIHDKIRSVIPMSIN